MKKILIFFCTVILFSFAPDHQIRDNDLIKLPVKFVDGYGPFQGSMSSIKWFQHPEDSDWGKTFVELAGVPESWNDRIVVRLFFDIQQFAYQSYQEGKMSQSFFDRLVNSWNMDLQNEFYSGIPIKCYTHITLGKDENNAILYKLDTDNDRDFSDEQTYKPHKLIRDKRDSLIRLAHPVMAEAYINGKVQQIKIPVLILEAGDGTVLETFPVYAQTEFMGRTINISAGFTNFSFRRKSSIIVGDPTVQSRETIELNEFFEIDGILFQNLGVNLHEKSLLLKKVTSDTAITSTQVGFLAKKFEGEDFITKEPIDLADYRGKFLFLEFWGSWCGPCIQELPNMKAAYEKTDRSRIEFLGIGMDNPRAFKKFLEKKDVPWQQILSTKENNIVDKYGIRSFPTSFLIDPEGNIVAKNLRGSNLMDTLNYYVNENK